MKFLKKFKNLKKQDKKIWIISNQIEAIDFKYKQSTSDDRQNRTAMEIHSDFKNMRRLYSQRRFLVAQNNWFRKMLLKDVNLTA